METVTEVTTQLIDSEVITHLESIDEGVLLLTHIAYLALALACAYGLYRLYAFVFRRFY